RSPPIARRRNLGARCVLGQCAESTVDVPSARKLSCMIRLACRRALPYRALHARCRALLICVFAAIAPVAAASSPSAAESFRATAAASEASEAGEGIEKDSAVGEPAIE